MSARGEINRSQRRLLSASLALAAAELQLPDGAAIAPMNAAERALYFAARDLVAAIDSLSPADRPKGWARTPEELPA